jgi:hypothetical protein
MIYSSKLKPTKIQEVLELGEEVLQEPIVERPQEETVAHAPELEEEPDFNMDDLNQYLVLVKQVDETRSGNDTIEAYLDPLREHTGVHSMRFEDTGLTGSSSIVQ